MTTLITKGRAALKQILIGGYEYGIITVANKTGASISANSLVKIAGYDTTLKCPTIVLADADTCNTAAQFIVPVAIANNKRGLAYEKYEAKGLNTSAGSVGDPVYLSTDAGGWTITAPTGADQIKQVVGYITVDSATVGKIMFLLQPRNIIAIGKSGIQNSAIEKSHLKGSFLKTNVIDGTAAATDVTITGMVATDELVFVGSLITKADIATFADRTSEYVCGAGKLVKAAGSNDSANQLIIIWLDIS